jgi:hypothetical protein
MKYHRFIFAAALLIKTFPLAADEQASHQEHFPTTFTPWFTGPLIAPSGYTVRPGHFNIEPYLYHYVYNGSYNQEWKRVSAPNLYHTALQVQLKVGLAERMDFQIFPQAVYRKFQGSRYCNVGDWPLGFGFQIVKARINEYLPGIKLVLRASLPMGKYQHLHADKQRTDAVGTGSWQPSFSVVCAKLFNTARKHYLDTRLAFNYQFGVPVHVKGLNSYGGASNTRGTVHLGNTFTVDGAFQYNLTQRWDLACDLYYTHSNSKHFSGKSGTTSSGSPAVMTAPSSEQFSLAPAIEYNWSKSLGIIGSVWFTFAGRNSNRFTSGFIALNIYI